MKKIYLFLFISIAVITQAQNSIPNGNFEQWTSASYDIPQYYLQSSNPSSFFRTQSPFNVVKTTDAFHGTYAVKLTTLFGSDTAMAYIVNANPSNGGNPCQWKGGIPYNQKPTGFRGHYKSNVMAGDSAGMLIAFKSAGTCLGVYMYKFGGVHNTYTPFSFTLSPALAATPDTVIFAAVSSDVFNKIQKVGSMIQLDSLAFTGVVSQPAQFNGDFESWQTNAINSPDNWYLNSNDQGDGINRTTDAYKGVYAMELTTYLGDHNNKPAAQGGGIGTGYYPNNCSGSCNQKGGYPFTNKIDTLAFYYKYAPMGNDSASISLNFKKNGSQTYSVGGSLHAASNYTYKEIPFNMGTTPDSVMVSFQSSNWSDTLLSFIGSDLKIDEVHFKSQPLHTGITNYEINKGISVYPNPSSDGVFQITNTGTKDVINVYNVLGEAVNTAIKRDNDGVSIRLASDAPGIYFIQVNSEGKIITKKIIVQ